MKNKFKPELIEKAKAAKSAAELITIAKENNVEITNEEAASYFAKLNPQSGDISDEELKSVAGGGCYSSNGYLVVTSLYSCYLFESRRAGGDVCANCKYHSFDDWTEICLNQDNRI